MKQTKILSMFTSALWFVASIAQSNNSPVQAPEISISNNINYYELQKTTPELTSAFINTTPERRDDGIKVGKLSSHPLAEKILTELGKEIENNKHTRYDSILISKNDQLLFESYYLKGRVNLPHSQASATKTYVTLAVGRAIQLGYLTMADLHKPVINFLKGLDAKKFAKGVDKITLDHTMSMRSGIRINEKFLDALDKKTENLTAQELVQTYFSKSSTITESSQVYRYQRSDPRITMLVLDSVVPGGAESFIKRELLNKIGIQTYDWEVNFGMLEGNYSAMLTSRDMLKLGRLMSDKGLWNKEQLIPTGFMDKAASKIAIPYSKEYDFSSFDYGYYIWQTDMKVDNKSYRCKLAWGGGGQYVIVFDELDLVIAVTARSRGTKDTTLELIEKRVLPLFT
ncbi:serine hydrolase domain-containing protein [Thalassotalea fusca]